MRFNNLFNRLLVLIFLTAIILSTVQIFHFYFLLKHYYDSLGKSGQFYDQKLFSNSISIIIAFIFFWFLVLVSLLVLYFVIKPHFIKYYKKESA